jgi:hypothetical protein
MSTRRSRRVVCICIMLRHAHWQVRHHRGQLGNLYRLEPWSPAR